jgi:hypothetical protein
MHLRRPERAAAALMLTALGASVALLANPSGSASAATNGGNIKASIRYGCSDGGWVEVTIKSRADQLQDSTDEQQLFQVGLTAAGSSTSEGPYPEGGPSQVVAGDTATTVRLAGPANDATAVFIRRVATGEVKTIPLPDDCRDRKPSDFGLDEPHLTVAAVTCTSAFKAQVRAQVGNPNTLDVPTERLGINELDYTVLLVRTEDAALMAPTQGELMRFDGPGKDSVDMTAPAETETAYEVRVIGVDGSVVTSSEMSLNCGAGNSPPPTTAPPTTTPSVSSTPPPTTTPAPRPTPTSPTPSTSSTHPSSSASHSQSSSQVQSSTPSASSSAGPGPIVMTPSRRVSSSAHVPIVGAPSGSTSSEPSPSPSFSPSGTLRHLVIADPPRTSPERLFVWQRDAALVVLLTAGAISALVGSTVYSAKRR